MCGTRPALHAAHVTDMATIHRVSCVREDPCSWTGDYTSLDRAEYGLSRHSCERQRTLDARAQRMADRVRAQGEVEPSPCLHVRTRHVHGTRACYVLDKCRCTPCREAHTTYEHDRQRQHTYGRWDNYVDAEPVRTHVRTLQGVGLGYKRVALAAGVSPTAVYKLLSGTKRPDGTSRRSERVSKTVATKLLAVPLPSIHALGSQVAVHGAGTARRIQALGALGWSVNAIAEQCGLDRFPLDSALAGQEITAKSALAVREVYEQLWDRRPAPSTRAEAVSVARTLRRATESGWAPPMAWDDDAIDDPQALPAPGWRAGECTEQGCPTTDLIALGLCRFHYDQRRRPANRAPAADLDEWAHLVRGGVAPERAAATLGVQLDAVERAASDNQHHEVLHLIRWLKVA